MRSTVKKTVNFIQAKHGVHAYEPINSTYPKECGQKSCGKLQVEPARWIKLIRPVTFNSVVDWNAINVQDHSQPSDKNDGEERGLY